MLKGDNAYNAYCVGSSAFRQFYESDPWWSAEWDYFQLLLAGDWRGGPNPKLIPAAMCSHFAGESVVPVDDAQFSRLRTQSRQSWRRHRHHGLCSRRFGRVAYGIESIPPEWISQLARKGEVDCLFHEFTNLCEQHERKTPYNMSATEPALAMTGAPMNALVLAHSLRHSTPLRIGCWPYPNTLVGVSYR